MQRTTKNMDDVLFHLHTHTEPLSGKELVFLLSLQMGKSSVYAALHALERRGLLVGTWDVTGNRPAYRYRLKEEQ